jgi:hypothetical protein
MHPAKVVQTDSERQAAELRWARSVKFWKRVAGASVAAALLVVIVTSLRDRNESRNEAERRGRVETTAARASAPPAPAATDVVAEDTLDADADGAELSAPAAAPDAGDAATTTTTGGEIVLADAAVAPPASAAMVDAALDAGASDLAAADTDAATTAALAPPDAGDAAAPDPWAPPSMSAGAGPFVTEAPYWAASAFQSNPNAGAGRFMTEAPPWSASAFTSNPEAGAGPFTTERNLPAFGVWPYGTLFPFVVPPR